MPVTYETWLVLLSIVMAIQGAYVGLSLAVADRRGATGLRRRLLLAGATVSFAVAIWTMHFVGMLAVRLPFQVDYLVFPTLLSFLVCAIVVGGAVYATSSGPLTLLRLTLSACLMGGGIFTMHYIGMSALDASTHMVHDRVYVAASMAIAIAASGLALWLATGRGGRAAADPFGARPSVSPFPACTTRPWAASTLEPFVTAASGAPALSTDLLAIVVAVVAFCVSGIFFLLLLPDSARVEQQSRRGCQQGAAATAVRNAGRARGRSRRGRRRGRIRNSAAAATRRSAAPERRRGASPAICRSSATAARIFSPSRTWSLFTPTRTTRTSSTATTNYFVRSRSATSSRGWTAIASCAFTAATSSISTGSSAIKRSGDNEMVEMASHAPLPGAGQPQPYRLAEIAGGEFERQQPRGCTSPPAPFCSAIDGGASSVPCADRSVMLTQFVQRCLPFVQRARVSCISAKLVKRCCCCNAQAANI